MIVSGNFETAKSGWQAVAILTGDVFGRTHIVAGDQDGEGGPHAYLVEQSSGVVLPPHFHLTDQLQVVMAGSVAVVEDVFPPWPCIWMSAGEQPGHITAGPQGADLLTLQFPQPHTAEAQAAEVQ